MLRELIIRNFAIIDSLSVEFRPGFNVISGETGAGKSIVVDALGLVLGERAQIDQIKAGQEEAEVQAYFDIEGVEALTALGIQAQEGVIVRRVVSRGGKSRAYVNDTLTSIRSLEDVGKLIAEIHGQNEHQSLLVPEKQLDLVDSYGRHAEIMDKYRAVFAAHRELAERLGDLRERVKERAQRMDLLQFQVEEIRSAAPKPGEGAELEQQRNILVNAAKLRALCEETYALLHESEQSVGSGLAVALGNLRTIEGVDQAAREVLDLLEAAAPLVADSIVSLRGLKDKYDADPQMLDEVQSRLELLKGLRRKYGETEEDVLRHLENAASELEALRGADEKIEDLSRELSSLDTELRRLADHLSAARRASAETIEQLVAEKLGALAFRNARFGISCARMTDEAGRAVLGPRGCDSIEFLFSANPAEPLKSLRKVASGGELSRITLAIKTVFAEVDDIPVMVFDEIDAGIGGKAAQTVGRALKELSSNHQVFCVTHLPQIASLADAHYRVEKTAEKKTTKVKVKLLTMEERIHEVARMLSGKITESSLKHSEELLSA